MSREPSHRLPGQPLLKDDVLAALPGPGEEPLLAADVFYKLALRRSVKAHSIRSILNELHGRGLAERSGEQRAYKWRRR